MSKKVENQKVGRRQQVPTRGESQANLSVTFSFRALMNPGTCFFNAGLQGGTATHLEGIYLHHIIDAVMFRVQADEGRRTNALVNFDIASMATSTEE